MTDDNTPTPTDVQGLIERLRHKALWVEPEHDIVDEADLLEAADALAALIAAGDKLAGYAGHDDTCEDVTGAYPGSCSCGYSAAMKAWKEARGDD